MILEVYPGLFAQQGLRFGDLVGVCNVLEYLRKIHKNKKIKFYVPDTAVYPEPHCYIFRDWLIENTNYLCGIKSQPKNLQQLDVIPGTDPTYPNMYNIWGMRESVVEPKQFVLSIKDLVKIPCKSPKQKKIVVAPLTDAAYNFERNWSLEMTQSIVNLGHQYEQGYERIIVSKQPILGLDLGLFRYSHDFKENLQHVIDCEYFIGGDTGWSHFASALQKRPECKFYYSSKTWGTTCPFYWKEYNDVNFY